MQAGLKGSTVSHLPCQQGKQIICAIKIAIFINVVFIDGSYVEQCFSAHSITHVDEQIPELQ